LKIEILDCTLRDGGYYNNWNFKRDLVQDYIKAMESAKINILELGFRSLINSGFKGPYAYTKDNFLQNLDISKKTKIAVMVNGSELITNINNQEYLLEKLFPNDANNSKVSIVRIPLYYHQLEDILPVSLWLKKKKYEVTFNLMQVSELNDDEILDFSKKLAKWPIDILYFADSLGSLTPERIKKIINLIKTNWKKEIGIHTHDNLGLALANSISAINEGVNWIDSTIKGMGRGAGNAKTEILSLELKLMKKIEINLIPILTLINKYFEPLKSKYNWGTNPYYHLSGKYGIHPTYIQEMLNDRRYSEVDIIGAIEHLKIQGGKKFSYNSLKNANSFFIGEPRGGWSPKKYLNNRNVLILGTGPGIKNYKEAIEHFIENENIIVIALNTQSNINYQLVDYFIACHPIRLLADCNTHIKIPKPLITPYSMLPDDLKQILSKKSEILDFGISVKKNTFKVDDNTCMVPKSLVIAYTLAVVQSGGVNKIFLAGFDGYGLDDPRNDEMNKLLTLYKKFYSNMEIIAITPTQYDIESLSIYGLI
jgi:4-hydroxy 2-oxovalerate aldolase